MRLSTTLPSAAPQKGYDIIDSGTMRLIERVPAALTEQELLEQAAKQKVEEEARLQAEEQAKQAEEARQAQQTYDKTLLITYRSEADLIRARDSDIAYRQEQIAMHQQKLPELKQYLYELQNEAAQRELSGAKVTANMQKRLDAAKEEIQVRQQAITELKTEITELQSKYQHDLERLNYLLKRKQ
jgi:regulator of replication initiation timing